MYVFALFALLRTDASAQTGETVIIEKIIINSFDDTRTWDSERPVDGEDPDIFGRIVVFDGPLVHGTCEDGTERKRCGKTYKQQNISSDMLPIELEFRYGTVEVEVGRNYVLKLIDDDDGLGRKNRSNDLMIKLPFMPISLLNPGDNMIKLEEGMWDVDVFFLSN